MWRILQQDVAEDYVIATGITTPVREFIRLAFDELGITLDFDGSGVEEKGYVVQCDNTEYSLPIGKVVVAVDPAYFRPTEVDLLIGDYSKARNKLNWNPVYNLQMLVKEMMESDISQFKQYGTNQLFAHFETF